MSINNYREMLRWAKETLGLAIKGQPKKEELQRLVAQAEAERQTTTDPTLLREGAQTLREIISQMAATAQAAEERAKQIETAQAGMGKTAGTLHAALMGYRDAVSQLTGLGLLFEWPSPLTAEFVDTAITALTPPVPPRQLYMFWATGRYTVGSGLIAAESFEAARERYGRGEVDYGATWTSLNPCLDGRRAAQAAIAALTEGGTAEATGYSTTVYTQTLGGAGKHLFEFNLEGPEYHGLALVGAQDFSSAKAKALAGDILEGDRPDPEIQTELQKAMEGLTENGTVQREGHTLTSRTIA